MKTKTLHLLIVFALLTTTLSCRLADLAGGGGAVPGEAKDPALYEFTGDVSPALVRLDQKEYKPEQFAARSLPVEVIPPEGFDLQVLASGALIHPNFNNADHTPSVIDAIIVLKTMQWPVFEQVNDEVSRPTLRMNCHVEVLDAGGATIFTFDKNAQALFPTYAQYFRFSTEEAPDNAAAVRVVIEGEKLNVTPPYAGPESLKFQVPDPIFLHTPVQFALELDDWAEEYAEQSVVADYYINFQGAYSQTIMLTPLVMFFDDAGSMVGWREMTGVLDSGKEWTPGGSQQSSYLSGVPTSVQVYYDFAFDDLYKAMQQ